VSDVRGTFQLGVPADNQGGAYVQRESGDIARCDGDSRCPFNVTTIIMDDLVEVVTFRRAAMKIDIEGHERRAFYHADRLFDNVHVGYIFMEWIKLRAFVDIPFSSLASKMYRPSVNILCGHPQYTCGSMAYFRALYFTFTLHCAPQP